MVVPRWLTRHPLRIFTTVVAFAFVFGPPIAMATGVTGSTIDNRRLAPPPSLAKGFDALDMLGPWATDRLAGRSNAVQAKAWVDYHVLGEMPSSGKVVRGRNGYLFLSDDFTRTCANHPAFRRSLRSFLELAEIIEASGRRAVFAVAPNKSAVVTENLPGAVPTGACALMAIAQQNLILEDLKHPAWVGAGPQLIAAQAAGQQPYARTDTHWTTSGSAVFAQAVAAELRPGLARRITITPTTVTKQGDLTKLIGVNAAEAQPSAELSVTGRTVKPDPRYDQYDPQRMRYGQERWKTRPARGLVPGKSLILGDSFAYTALGNLRPLFANGTFLWTGYTGPDEIIRQIEASDTVVIEVVQRNVTSSHLFARPDFQAKVARALDGGHRAGSPENDAATPPTPISLAR